MGDIGRRRDNSFIHFSAVLRTTHKSTKNAEGDGGGTQEKQKNAYKFNKGGAGESKVGMASLRRFWLQETKPLHKRKSWAHRTPVSRWIGGQGG